MEKNKYLPPKFSYSFSDLANYIGVFEQIEVEGDELSANSSSLSLMSV
jgi:hypothetical protein